jgi:hypothetical protein
VKFISNLARGESSNYSDIDVVYDVLFMRERARFSGFCYAVRFVAMQCSGRVSPWPTLFFATGTAPRAEQTLRLFKSLERAKQGRWTGRETRAERMGLPRCVRACLQTFISSCGIRLKRFPALSPAAGAVRRHRPSTRQTCLARAAPTKFKFLSTVHRIRDGQKGCVRGILRLKNRRRGLHGRSTGFNLLVASVGTWKGGKRWEEMACAASWVGREGLCVGREVP